MSKSITEKTIVIKAVNVGEYILNKPNVRIISEDRQFSFGRGHTVKLAFGYDANEPIEDFGFREPRNGCSFSEQNLRDLIKEFTILADYLKEKNAGN